MNKAESAIEIIALSLAAILLASTMQLIPVWCGVMLAYIAHLRARGVQPVRVVDKRGMMVISLNLTERMAFCLIVRHPAQQRQVWQLQGAM